MDFELTEEQKILRREIRKFAAEELNDGIEERDHEQTFSRESWRKCGEMGLQGLPVPEEYGGSGLDPLSCAIALEALGYGSRDGGLTFAVCAHMLACVVPIWKHGTEPLKRRYLPKLCKGELIAVNGMTEAGAGSDAFRIASRAEPHGDGYRINGAKIFGSNGPVADIALVYTVTDPNKGYHGGLSAFVVERGPKGFRDGQEFEKLGLRTCPIGELILENAEVPADAVVGGIGGGAAVFSESMEWERVLLVACHIGTMERLLERAIEQARVRSQYGQPIGKFQAISHKIVDMKVRLEAARLLTYRAAWTLGRTRSMAMDASITKLFVSESLVKSALAAVQVFGGYGFMKEYEVERALRDSIGGTLYSGTSEIQRNIIAGWLGL